MQGRSPPPPYLAPWRDGTASGPTHLPPLPSRTGMPHKMSPSIDCSAGRYQVMTGHTKVQFGTRKASPRFRVSQNVARSQYYMITSQYDMIRSLFFIIIPQYCMIISQYYMIKSSYHAIKS